MTNTINGTLESITSVNTTRKVYSAGELDDEEIGRETGKLRTTITDIVIKTKKTRRKVSFPGIVFPDSIGHKVKYFVEEIGGTSMMGSGMKVGEAHYLKDLEIDRTYIGCVRWETY